MSDRRREGQVSDRLLVVDSWLVLDGQVRAMERHVDRFTRACLATAAVSRAELLGFWSDVLGDLPRSGAWFPRVELGKTTHLQVEMRPAPERGEHVRVWVPDEPDRRACPGRKGPDLGAMLRLRAEAESVGAQEALLTTPDGVVVEACTSSILWWEDGVLCSPPEAIPALPGTTASLVRDLAAQRGIPTAQRARRVGELSGREVWLLNALHGIRLVTAWSGQDVTPGAGEYFAEWRQEVERLRFPLDPQPAAWLRQLDIFQER
jgi:branched-subunit amino acid aminotransferase/4-amino-4-deoxychorismate lyase